MDDFWEKECVNNPLHFLATEKKEWELEEYFATGRIEVDKRLTYLKENGFVPHKAQVMLEIGCGYGRMSCEFAKYFGSVYAIDISKVMIENAQKRFKDVTNINFSENNGLDLAAYAQNMFDFCFSQDVFPYLPSSILLNYIKEVSRVLKSGGVFFFQVDGRKKTWLQNTKAFLFGVLYHLGIKELAGKKTSPIWRWQRTPYKTLEKCLYESGFTILKAEGDKTYYLWVLCRKQ